MKEKKKREKSLRPVYNTHTFLHYPKRCETKQNNNKKMMKKKTTIKKIL